MCSLLYCFHVPLVLDALSGLLCLHSWGPSLSRPLLITLCYWGRGEALPGDHLWVDMGIIWLCNNKNYCPKSKIVFTMISSFKKRGNIYMLFMPFLLLWSHTVRVTHKTLPSQPSPLSSRAAMSPLMMSRKKSAGLLWVSQVYPFKWKHVLYRSCAD